MIAAPAQPDDAKGPEREGEPIPRRSGLLIAQPVFREEAGGSAHPFPGPQVLLLGPLMVLDDGGSEIEMPAARLVRAVLEALALRAGSVVQTWELFNTVWGDEPPLSVGKCLQTYIGVLRRTLGSTTIETVGGGYRLRVDENNVDLNQFERYIRLGSAHLTRGKYESAADSFTVALGMWRGEPLQELDDSPTGMALLARLDELHGMAEERLFEARLGLGEHDVLVADLEAAVRTEPFRERRWEQLMIALYRSGRQGDALAAFDRMLTLLHRHGLSPGDKVRTLRAGIARRDPSLALGVGPSQRWRHHFGAVGS
jgi:DNA-binding SARP family transcriptional activator